MANIMINERCNFNCPYCFASEFTLDSKYKNMSLEDFKYALEFALSSGPRRIGIIGGEPTLHPQFKEIMEILIYDKRVDQVVVFTNGSNIHTHINLFTHSKVGMLINYNSEEDVGKKNFDRVNENIRMMQEDYYLGSKVHLGINMYKPNFEYKYMLDALKKYNKTSVRTSISMPMVMEGVDPLEHMESMKSSVFKFFSELERIGVMPNYDCNLMPPCIPTDQERAWLNNFLNKHKERGSNILSVPDCCPVIDITVDLIAIRCFGLSETSKADIRQFKDIYELNKFYMNQVDSFKHLTYASKRCEECELAAKGLCTGACLGYKINKMNTMRDLIRNVQVGG